MLIQLSIRDIVLIDKLDLAPGAGLTVLTGETGAGKSILLDAFALALGGRGDGTLVRQGQAQGQVTASFDLAVDHPAIQLARSHDIEADGELIMRRVQLADGRTRAFVNDQAVSAQTARSIGASLVEIHGQHDDRALVDPAMHRALIDAYGGLDKKVVEVRAMHGRVRSAQSELASEQARIEAARKEADFLRHAHEELTKLAPIANEEQELAARRTAMMQGEKVTSELREAQGALRGEDSPGSILSSALRRLERRASQAPALIEPSLKALDAALNAAELAAQTVDAALQSCDFNPRELERTEERLFALRAASRKYATPVDNLAALAARYGADLAALDAGEANLVKLDKALREARTAFDAAAATLSAARRKAAAQLDKAVNAELPPLKLEQARFTTAIESDPTSPSADGIDRVEFWVQTNPGTRPGPLLKVASGGELARFMLALKVVLADRGSAPTLVFDEIDTGVGGAVADAIGHRLARLASKVQVLAVTHAPQVAARAGGHMRIAKAAADKGKRVATRVEALDPADRREEIARMLAGATITEEARAAARRLIESAK
ncbi:MULTISPECIES: DNA repair protein RecN [unclassified Beijerinckia]|uniref:DNA repair protein RecN n=1 Tax=unclassified Beijerinckia TaxID=2638183 RepID=UPI00089C091A|nr:MULTISPECIES: DNA repair protein RecN [unclassified Beijerinckia]MDH7799606.1 DNA repair protein RecN (Recombination protein N) [Beijerinckia sp. GAS462]SEB47655.1 DNA replication and repair protein RecN [Beijerinckia sp. 28-YEA-48]